MLEEVAERERLAKEQVASRSAALSKSSAGAELAALPAKFAELNARTSALRQVAALRPPHHAPNVCPLPWPALVSLGHGHKS